MNPFAPGLRELARIVGRQASRLQAILERRKLARLETTLGLLGWQQADFDRRTQEHVDRLMNCEREQGRLTNESAAIGLKIEEIEQRRGTEARELAEAEAIALEKERPTAASAEALEVQVVAKRRECGEIAARLPAIDREINGAEEHYRALVAPGLPPPLVQDQLLHWRKVLIALPREKAEWVAKLRQAEEELSGMETLLKALRDARIRFASRDQEWAEDMAARHRAKRKVERAIEALEKAKSNPYREIGRELANQHIGPLNQPEALDAVVEQREKIAAIEAAIAASLAASARERRTTAWKPWMVAGGMSGMGPAALLAMGG